MSVNMSKPTKTTEKVKKTRPDGLHGVRFDGEWPKFTPFVDKLWESTISKLRRIGNTRIITNVFSRINRSGAWKEIWNKTRDQKMLVHSALVAQLGPHPPSEITDAIGFDNIDAPGLIVAMTRHGASYIDSDNVESGFKGIRDAIADWLRVSDADFRISWICRQKECGEGKEEKLPVVDISFYEEPRIYDGSSYIAIAPASVAFSNMPAASANGARVDIKEIKRQVLMGLVEKAKKKPKKIPDERREKLRELVGGNTATNAAYSPASTTDDETKKRLASGEAMWDIVLSNARRR